MHAQRLQAGQVEPLVGGEGATARELLEALDGEDCSDEESPTYPRSSSCISLTRRDRSGPGRKPSSSLLIST